MYVFKFRIQVFMGIQLDGHDDDDDVSLCLVPASFSFTQQSSSCPFVASPLELKSSSHLLKIGEGNDTCAASSS